MPKKRYDSIACTSTLKKTDLDRKAFVQQIPKSTEPTGNRRGKASRIRAVVATKQLRSTAGAE